MNSNEIFCYSVEEDYICILKLAYKEEQSSRYMSDSGDVFRLYEREIISHDMCVDNIDPFFKLLFFESRDKCLEFRKIAINTRMNWVRGEIARHTADLNMYAKWLEKDMKEESK